MLPDTNPESKGNARFFIFFLTRTKYIYGYVSLGMKELVVSKILLHPKYIVLSSIYASL